MKIDELFFYFSLFFLSFMIGVKVESGDYDIQLKKINNVKCSLYKKISKNKVKNRYFKDCF